MNLLLVFISVISSFVSGYTMEAVDKVFRGKGLASDFGDYNYDGQLDLITYEVNLSTSSTTVYIYRNVSKDMEQGSLFYTTNVEGIAVGLVATDLSGDNFLDILLVMKNERPVGEMKIAKPLGSSPHGYYLLGLYKSKGEMRFVSSWDSRIDVPSIKGYEKIDHTGMMTTGYKYVSIHPLLADVNGDGQVDIVAQTFSGEVFAFIADSGNFYPYLLKDIPNCMFVGEVSGFIPSPHSSAFVDMDGDCRADFVFVVNSGGTSHIEIWLSSFSEGKLVYTRENYVIPLPKNYGQLLFSDFNGDGTIDIAVPFCDVLDGSGNFSGQCKVAITFNKQMPFCNKMWQTQHQTECRHASNMCIHSDMSFNDLREQTAVIINLKEYKFIGDYNNPVTLAIGDFNNNGFPDIIIPVTKYNTSEDSILIFKNIRQSERSIEVSEPIEVKIKPKDDLESFNILKATTIDIFEDGVLNLMVFTRGKDFKLDCYFFGLVEEQLGLFMKVTTRNVLLDDTKYERLFSFGYNIPGPTYKITVIDLDGTKTPRSTTLRIQSAHSPLQPPCNIIGLGETNNYVEEFVLGMPSRNKQYSNMWISIIPNCSVMVIPYPLNYPTEWELKLSLSPSKQINTILLATLICLAAFGLVILIFEMKEKREDSEQSKGFRQKFIIN